MHVVKPVVVKMSLADTINVNVARSGIPTSHREGTGGDLILNRNQKKAIPILLDTAQEGEWSAAKLYMRKEIKGFRMRRGYGKILKANRW